MKELIQNELKSVKQPQLKRLALAEFLQHLILQSLSRLGAFKHLVFTGGTALRLLYHTSRYSEDLDFSLTDPKDFEFRPLLEKVQSDLDLQQLGFEIYPSEVKAVAKADLRFSHLIKEFGISPLRDQKLTIKIEVDKRPLQGGKKEIASVTSPVAYTVTAFDLSSLFATKLHAVFFRGYTKGRDYYDLMWFLGKGVKPNFKLLNHAIRQTQGTGFEVSEGDFKDKLLEHLESIDFGKVCSEVERFIIDQEQLKILNLEAVRSLLRNY